MINIALNIILVIMVIYDIYVSMMLDKHEQAIAVLLWKHPNLLEDDEEMM